MKRNLYDDFLDQLPRSTNDRRLGLVLMQGNKLVEGLVYNSCNVVEVRAPLGGLDMFKLWYGQRNLQHPLCNRWKYDMEKLVVPNVFPDIDLLRVVASRYDPDSWTVRDSDGEVMLTINKEEFQQVFDLSDPSTSMTPIDAEAFKAEYEMSHAFFRTKLLHPHLARARGQRYQIDQDEQEPLRIECFAKHFLGTYYSLCQILGLQLGPVVPISFMFMGVQIQHPNFLVVYDFATTLAESVHKGLRWL